MNEELKQDLELARNVLADTYSLYKKYHVKDIPDLIEVLTIAVECSIPVEELRVSGFEVELLDVGRYFTFKVTQDPPLLNKTTFRTCKPTKWYITFSCGGCGVLNICSDNNVAYKTEVQQIWKEFLKWVKSYNPIDWDKLNHKYIFSVEDGYRLHRDFEDKYHDVCLQVERITTQYKIAELQAKIDGLKEDI